MSHLINDIAVGRWQIKVIKPFLFTLNSSLTYLHYKRKELQRNSVLFTHALSTYEMDIAVKVHFCVTDVHY